MGGWAAVVAAAAAAGCSVVGSLWVISGRRQRQRRRCNSTTADTARTKQAHATDSSRPAAAAAIPPDELRRLQALLRRVCRWRGWAGGPYHFTEAWHAVETQAASPAGGGWPAQFGGAQLTAPACDALLRVIDQQFFGGRLLRKLAAAAAVREGGGGGAAVAAGAAAADAMQQQQQQQQPEQQPEEQASRPPTAPAHQQPHGASGQQQQQQQLVVPSKLPPSSSSAQQHHGRQPLRCEVVQAFDAPWLAYFDTTHNAIFLNCWRWAKPVSPQQPWNCEGVLCSSRRQLLVHTLGHELVHAIVFHLLPDIDAGSPAYTANSRHGPIFALLNKQLFGHSSDALQQCAM